MAVLYPSLASFLYVRSCVENAYVGSLFFKRIAAIEVAPKTPSKL